MTSRSQHLSPAQAASAAALGPPPTSDESDRQLAAAPWSAQDSTREAIECFDRFVQAMRDNDGAETAKNDLDAAIAQHGYAWALLHRTVIDIATQHGGRALR